MKAEYINPFLVGTQRSLSGICGYEGRLGKVSFKLPPYSPRDVAVVIGFNGDLKGEVVFTMDEGCGLYLASKFMAGVNPTRMDDMAQSCIMELANIISGNAALALFGLGLNVNITPPTYVIGGTGLEFVQSGSKLLCMPIFIRGGQVFEVDLHFA
ncbi:MAG: chemotaxis protein CheX [Clostridiales bacterium]|jgi:chemotaxis protein CheX|nr:chemotaxis protein CheX [Clostridiales bacterium]